MHYHHGKTVDANLVISAMRQDCRGPLEIDKCQIDLRCDAPRSWTLTGFFQMGDWPDRDALKDIPIKEIIGYGTKQGGLYYMDDYNCSLTNFAQEMSSMEKQIWLWPSRLVHPSVTYLRYNRGKPPYQYSPDLEEKKAKYPIPDYVSINNLSKSLKAFTYNLFSANIPSTVQEA
ncbi:hypothetical protein BC332_08102 [Capsicum chinense]|nr:hypothetical protein BC332_08102 [Capsicum chinense]